MKKFIALLLSLASVQFQIHCDGQNRKGLGELDINEMNERKKLLNTKITSIKNNLDKKIIVSLISSDVVGFGAQEYTIEPNAKLDKQIRIPFKQEARAASEAVKQGKAMGLYLSKNCKVEIQARGYYKLYLEHTREGQDLVIEGGMEAMDTKPLANLPKMIGKNLNLTLTSDGSLEIGANGEGPIIVELPKEEKISMAEEGKKELDVIRKPFISQLKKATSKKEMADATKEFLKSLSKS